MDWATTTAEIESVLKIAGSAGLGTFLVGLYRDSKTRKNHGAYLAMRLASILESFAFACAIRASSNSNLDAEPGEEIPRWVTDLPILLEYPADDDGWRHLERSLADEALRFRNKLAISQRSIDDTNDAPWEMLDSLNIEMSERGIEATMLANRMRRQYRLTFLEAGQWDYFKTLIALRKEAHANAERTQASYVKLENL